MRPVSSVLQGVVSLLSSDLTLAGGADVSVRLDKEVVSLIAVARGALEASPSDKDEDEDGAEEVPAVPKKALVALALTRSFLALRGLEAPLGPGLEQLYLEVGELVDVGRKTWRPTFPPDELVERVDVERLRLLSAETAGDSTGESAEGA